METKLTLFFAIFTSVIMLFIYYDINKITDKYIYKRKHLKDLQNNGVLTKKEMRQLRDKLIILEKLRELEEQKEIILKLKEANLITPDEYSKKIEILNNYCKDYKNL